MKPFMTYFIVRLQFEHNFKLFIQLTTWMKCTSNYFPWGLSGITSCGKVIKCLHTSELVSSYPNDNLLGGIIRYMGKILSSFK